MRVWRVVLMLVVFLLLTSGQFMQMIDQAYAVCCNIYKPPCTRWSALVYGSAELSGAVADVTSHKAIIKSDKGYSKEVVVSEAVWEDFKHEKVNKDYGFSVLSIVNNELVLVAFVSANRDHQPPAAVDKPFVGAGQVVERYNKEFEEVATPPGSKH